MAQTVKNLPSMPETQDRSLGWEDALEKGMASQSNILAWNSKDRGGAWWTTVHEVEMSQTNKAINSFTFILTI